MPLPFLVCEFGDSLGEKQFPCMLSQKIIADL